MCAAISQNLPPPDYHFHTNKSYLLKKIAQIVFPLLMVVAGIGLCYTSLGTSLFNWEVSIMTLSLVSFIALHCLQINYGFSITFNTKLDYYSNRKNDDVIHQFNRDIKNAYYYFSDENAFVSKCLSDPLLRPFHALLEQHGSDPVAFGLAIDHERGVDQEALMSAYHRYRLEAFNAFLINTLKIDPQQIYPFAMQGSLADFAEKPLRDVAYPTIGINATYNFGQMRRFDSSNTGYFLYKKRGQLMMDVVQKFEKTNSMSGEAVLYVLARSTVNLQTGNVVVTAHESSSRPNHVKSYFYENPNS